MNQHVDVVIPLYNGARWIIETLESVRGQSLPPARIIVVDDGSTDNGDRLAAKIPEVVVVKNPRKSEAAARGYGLSLATAPLVAFLDHDDLWHPHHLQTLTRLLSRTPDAPMAVSGVTSFLPGDTPQFDLSDTSIERFDPWQTYPCHGFPCSPGTTVYRREAAMAAGGWQASHSGMSDYSLFMHVAAVHPSVRTRAKTLAHRVHEHSRTCHLRKDMMKYLSLAIQVDDDLLRHYRSVLPDPAKIGLAAHRNQYLHSCRELTRALVSHNKREALAVLGTFEKNLAPESFDYRKALINHFFYMITQAPDLPPGDVFEMLLELWPPSDGITRKALKETIVDECPGARFYLTHFFKNPLQPSRLGLLLSAAARKIG